MSPQNKPTPSPILYQNQPQTIFLLDIPTSIEKAQTLPTVSHNHNHTNQAPSPSTHLLSTTPPQTPYNKSGSGSKNTEPKTAAARERVLARIPEKEKTYHERVIGPVVCDAIEVIREEYHYRGGVGEWCLPRCVVGEGGVVEGLDRRDEDGDDFQSSTGQYDDDDDTGLGSGSGSGSRSKPTSNQPPVILSPTSINEFPSITTELINQPVKNTSPEPAILRSIQNQNQTHPETFIIPPLANFILCTIPTTQMPKQTKYSPALIPGLEGKRFNLILLDPPWSNRSVRRARVYQTNRYFDMDGLTRRIGDILRVHLYADRGTGTDDEAQNQTGIAAIWVTNSSKSRNAAYNALQSVGLSVIEEWIWVKTTTQGGPITPVDGIWRKPYEILVIGRRQAAAITAGEDSAAHGRDGYPGRTTITRRVIAAVPDVHSRKPNLKELFETLFFTAHSSLDQETSTRMSYSALEVFARNLTAGWWACGDEVLKFNEQRWWTQGAR